MDSSRRSGSGSDDEQGGWERNSPEEEEKATKKQPQKTDVQHAADHAFQELKRVLEEYCSESCSDIPLIVGRIKFSFEAAFQGLSEQGRVDLYNAILPLVQPENLLQELTADASSHLNIHRLFGMPKQILNKHFKVRVPYQAKSIFSKFFRFYHHAKNISALKKEMEQKKKAAEDGPIDLDRYRDDIALEKQLLRELSPYFLSPFFLMYENLDRYYFPFNWLLRIIAGATLIPLLGVFLFELCKNIVFFALTALSMLITNVIGEDAYMVCIDYNQPKRRAVKIDVINGLKSRSAKTANMTDEDFLEENKREARRIGQLVNSRLVSDMMGSGRLMLLMAESCFKNLFRPLSTRSNPRGLIAQGFFFLLRFVELAFIIVSLLVIAVLELAAKIIDLAASISEVPAFIISLPSLLILNSPLLIKDGIAACCGCSEKLESVPRDSTTIQAFLTPNRRTSDPSAREANSALVAAEFSTSSTPPSPRPSSQREFFSSELVGQSTTARMMQVGPPSRPTGAVIAPTSHLRSLLGSYAGESDPCGVGRDDSPHSSRVLDDSQYGLPFEEVERIVVKTKDSRVRVSAQADEALPPRRPSSSHSDSSPATSPSSSPRVSPRGSGKRSFYFLADTTARGNISCTCFSGEYACAWLSLTY